MPSMEQRDLWDGFYRANGRAWRGNSRIPDPLSGRGDALDLGCGNGKTVSTLIDLGYSVVGTDFSPEAVELCRERFEGTARFEVCDIADLPFPDGSFDYVTAVHVLEHIEDSGMQTVADGIMRVLRPGGYVFVRSFTPTDMRSGTRSGDGPGSSLRSRRSSRDASTSARASGPPGRGRNAFSGSLWRTGSLTTLNYGPRLYRDS